jgi:hypothetical protein
MRAAQKRQLIVRFGTLEGTRTLESSSKWYAAIECGDRALTNTLRMLLDGRDFLGSPIAVLEARPVQQIILSSLTSREALSSPFPDCAVGKMPRAPEAKLVVYISTLTTPESMVEAAYKPFWQKAGPQLLLGKQVVIGHRPPNGTPGHSRSALGTGEVVAYVERIGKHIAVRSNDPAVPGRPKPDTATLLDVKNNGVNVVLNTVPLNPPTTLSECGRHLKSCIVCFQPIRTASTPWIRREAASFCYRKFRITGDSEEISHPRHPTSLCKPCLRKHTEASLDSGRLYCTCPMPDCGRSLQTRELKDVVSSELYERLIQNIRDSEKSMLQTFQLPPGIELRLCPQCHIRIEKNEGCNSMRCYRCGNKFAWNSAELVPSPEQILLETRGRDMRAIATGSELLNINEAFSATVATADLNVSWVPLVITYIQNVRDVTSLGPAIAASLRLHGQPVQTVEQLLPLVNRAFQGGLAAAWANPGQRGSNYSEACVDYVSRLAARTGMSSS